MLRWTVALALLATNAAYAAAAGRNRSRPPESIPAADSARIGPALGDLRSADIAGTPESSLKGDLALPDSLTPESRSPEAAEGVAAEAIDAAPPGDQRNVNPGRTYDNLRDAMLSWVAEQRASRANPAAAAQ